MDDYEAREIMEALSALKSQLKEIRENLSTSGDDEMSFVRTYSSEIDDFETTLTPHEINALLFTPVEDKKTRVSGENGQNSGRHTEGDSGRDSEMDAADEIIEIRTKLAALTEQSDKELAEIKTSISALSEMWGRHELEILRMKKHRT
ncbi:MAG: hypothetical protein WC834_06305 [Eubacteriales bacterium]